MSSCRFIFSTGAVSPTNTPVSTFLESRPGAYTTTRTHNNGTSILLWDKHMRRLAHSVHVLYNSKPQLLFGLDVVTAPIFTGSVNILSLESAVKFLVTDSMRKVLKLAVKEMSSCEELAVTTLVSGDLGKLSECDQFGDDVEMLSRVLDVHVHAGIYVPSVFGAQDNCAHLAAVGAGRDVAAAKYSDWVRLRKPLEKLRPPSTTELLLSNDGDQLLEGCLTNFFVVCHRDINGNQGKYLQDNKRICSYEVQTAPISDGVLPGVVRQLVLEVCSSKGIPVREIAPSWSQHEMWEEAFITNSLRLMQHVETIRVPKSWPTPVSKTWRDISWDEKHFQHGPGMITTIIQQAIMEEIASEGYRSSYSH